MIERDASRLLVITSCATFLATMPHVIEDFASAVSAKYHLATEPAAILVAMVVMMQVYGTASAARHERMGYWLCVLTGLFWVLGAVYDHMPELFSGTFRLGAWSVALVLGIIILHGATALLAIVALQCRASAT